MNFVPVIALTALALLAVLLDDRRSRAIRRTRVRTGLQQLFAADPGPEPQPAIRRILDLPAQDIDQLLAGICRANAADQAADNPATKE